MEIKDEDHPQGEIEISFTGLRPGEKLYEELLIGNNGSKTSHPGIMRAEEQVTAWVDLEKILVTLEQATEEDNFELVGNILARVVPDFVPQSGVGDLLWQQTKNNLVVR